MNPHEPIRVRTRSRSCACEWESDEFEWHLTALNLRCPVHHYLVREIRDGWLWCSSPRSTFSLTLAEGKVTQAPPIARRWALGSSLGELLGRLDKKWTVLYFRPNGEAQ